ncbi:g6406 [Coccomyxa viridis]|uniref:G6406 protein n=1 Tax=Coccomyxa viridis TaxID=1274662 RepID=A0ABP1FZA0_9CHLO
MASKSGEAKISPDLKAEDVAEDFDDKKHASTDGYVFNSPADMQDIRMQRQAVWGLLKNLGSHILREGVNLTRITLPIRVFETRSFLQRLTDNWAYIHLLEQAADAADPADRMRYLVAFVIGGLRRQTSTLKPFNPILGETYQAQYSSGLQVYAEQSSHHPPFIFFGNGNWKASARGNSIWGQQSGRNSVLFTRDGSTVSWELPKLLLKGILWGERVLKYSGAIAFEDDKNGIRCNVSIEGSQPGLLSSLWRSKKSRKHDELHGTLQKGDKVLDTIHGSWLTSVEWAKWGSGKKIWDAAMSEVHAPQPVKAPLPSDSRHRGDLKALVEGNVEGAQEQKSKLEQLQRSDQALRMVAKKAAAA